MKEIKKKTVDDFGSYLAPTTREFLLTSNRRRENVVTLWSANRLDVANKSALRVRKEKKKKVELNRKAGSVEI